MNRAATIAFAPLSLIYGTAMKMRSAGYRRGLLQTHRVAMPVISVGNITTGGTGKSPLVAWLARELADRGRRVCVLTRGYRRSNSHERVVVSDGQQITSDVIHAGDEPMMLAEALLGKAAVICDVNRVAAANWAIENLKSDVAILDDGFQHLRIARDLDIVTVDAMKPFGNNWLLPAGNLREPVNNLKRADCIVLTRSNEAEATDLQKQLSELTCVPVLTSQTLVKAIRRVDSPDACDKHVLRNTPLAAFCGIGNPAAFFAQLRAEGLDVRHTATFRDHHVYSQSDIDQLSRDTIARGAQALITTAKDTVKLRTLRFGLPCLVVEIKMEIAKANELRQLVDRAINRGT